MNTDDHAADTVFDPTDPQALMAYADGQLDPLEAARVEAAIARDPALADIVDGHRALRARIDAAFSGVLAEPVPTRLRDTLQVSVRDRVRPRLNRTTPRARWARREWLAMAASVVLGAAFALLLALPRRDARQLDGAMVAGTLVDSGLAARGALARALDRQLAGAGDAGLRLGLSFRAVDGRYCRVFRLQAPRPLAGLACHDADAWRISTLAATGAAASTPMRQAGSALPPAVLADIDARIDGQSLDADAERKARAAGWR
jgi:hypothetical protein